MTGDQTTKIETSSSSERGGLRGGGAGGGDRKPGVMSTSPQPLSLPISSSRTHKHTGCDCN